MKVHHGIVFLHLNQFHFFQLLDAGLHQRSLRGLVAEAVDEFLRFGYFPVLGLFLAQKDFLPQLAFLQEVGKVPRIFLRTAMIKGDGPGNQGIQQGHVMGDDYDGSAVGAQVLFHPSLGLDIQMVGGFVQQQHFRLPEKKLRQRDAHLPAAGEFPAVPVEIPVLESEAA